ncbi:hypothetical protein [Synechococcus elongatus]|uniref:hypothetical protein n=1 Tax=Synechococcus elongatus TaxID=32046 RepID=UPI0030D5D836
MPRKISEIFGVSEHSLEKEGVFNCFIDLDSKLYVDPRLLENTTIPELQGSYIKFKDYFAAIIHLLTAANTTKDVCFKTAYKKLMFPELKLVTLGYSTEGNSGSGIGKGIALELAKTAWEIVKAGISDPVIFELVGLIEENIGADRISDMVIHIILLDLLAYSERVAKNLDLNICQVKVRSKNYSLPTIPASRRPIVFIPCEILNDLPVANGWDDIDQVCAHNEELRNQVNEIIGDSWRDAKGRKKRITKRDLREILLHNPEIFRELIKQYKNNPAKRYDFEKDPSGQLIWNDIAKDFAIRHPLVLEVGDVTPENILQIVLKICEHFKILVENNGLSAHFWNESKSLRNERFAQLLFFGIADAYCAAYNLDLSREPNAGRGPVDFKVSRGYEVRVNVEVKYTSNNKMRLGYEKQLPIYNSAEKTDHSIFLIIRTTESIKALEELIELRKGEISAGKRAPFIFVVDGRLLPSASKIK